MKVLIDFDKIREANIEDKDKALEYVMEKIRQIGLGKFKHVSIEVTADIVTEDYPEENIVVLVELDGTKESSKEYRRILEEFYKEPEKLKGAMILFKVMRNE